VSDVPYRRTFVRLLGFLRPYRWSLLVSTILAVLSQAAAIAIVLLVGEAIDGIEAGRGTTVLAWLVVAICIVGIAKAALMLGRRIISGRQALGIEKDMREGLYAHLLRLSFGFYDRHQTGQLMSRATVDLQAVRFFLGFGLIFFFQHILTIVGVGPAGHRGTINIGAVTDFWLPISSLPALGAPPRMLKKAGADLLQM